MTIAEFYRSTQPKNVLFGLNYDITGEEPDIELGKPVVESDNADALQELSHFVRTLLPMSHVNNVAKQLFIKLYTADSFAVFICHGRLVATFLWMHKLPDEQIFDNPVWHAIRAIDDDDHRRATTIRYVDLYVAYNMSMLNPDAAVEHSRKLWDRIDAAIIPLDLVAKLEPRDHTSAPVTAQWLYAAECKDLLRISRAGKTEECV